MCPYPFWLKLIAWPPVSLGTAVGSQALRIAGKSVSCHLCASAIAGWRLSSCRCGDCDSFLVKGFIEPTCVLCFARQLCLLARLNGNRGGTDRGHPTYAHRVEPRNGLEPRSARLVASRSPTRMRCRPRLLVRHRGHSQDPLRRGIAHLPPKVVVAATTERRRTVRERSL